MENNFYIRGVRNHGNEVIDELKMRGGIKIPGILGNEESALYYISNKTKHIKCVLDSSHEGDLLKDFCEEIYITQQKLFVRKEEHYLRTELLSKIKALDDDGKLNYSSCSNIIMNYTCFSCELCTHCSQNYNEKTSKCLEYREPILDITFANSCKHFTMAQVTNSSKIHTITTK